MRIHKQFEVYKGLPRSIYILFIARVVNSMGMFVYPFLALFLTKKMGLDAQTAGLFASIGGFLFIPASIIGGKLADHFGRKRTILVFQFSAALTFITCGFLGNSMFVPWLLILAGFLGGLSDPASSAMVADLTNAKNRKPAYSLLYLGINVGVAVGSLVAGFLFEHFTRWIFWGDGLTSIMSLALVLFYVKETKPTKEEIERREDIKDSDERAEEGSVFTALAKRPILVAFVIINSILGFVYSQHSFSIPQQLAAIFPNGGEMFGGLMSINAVVVLLMTIPLTSLTKTFKPIQNVAIAGLLYAIGFGMIYYTREYPLFIVSTVLWTMGEILAVTNTGAFIANHSPITHRGRFSSIFSIIGGMGYSLGPLMMGSYIKYNGVRAVWPLVFSLAISASALFYILYKIEQSVKRRETIAN
jgi:MFS family permease